MKSVPWVLALLLVAGATYQLAPPDVQPPPPDVPIERGAPIAHGGSDRDPLAGALGSPTTPRGEPAVDPARCERRGDTYHTNFAYLAFVDAADVETTPIPPTVRALHGKRVALDGHMVALDQRAGRASRFMLSRYLEGCCYSREPWLSEWILVELPPGQSTPVVAEIIRITGQLEVGIVRDETGFPTALYRMRAAAVLPAASR